MATVVGGAKMGSGRRNGRKYKAEWAEWVVEGEKGVKQGSAKEVEVEGICGIPESSGRMSPPDAITSPPSPPPL